MSDDKDGVYCTICGGMVPEGDNIKKIDIDGIITGINMLSRIIQDVKKDPPGTDAGITEELLKRTEKLNYIPSKKRESYGRALLSEYKNFIG
ncbi:NAC family transcription factor [Methanoplanus endosymbiosus]|uniref:NAC family transcription factor n=1 Tax=Methanoplanus endosymbiosus TaxID=33865 RepID=A0A9E7PQS0_9EURY|nr:NAC family transcription factor [Methanoplanus endosymbiosus]UUX93617.1 NAC family transcription factor [Methanoplanus endosymbiosus]